MPSPKKLPSGVFRSNSDVESFEVFEGQNVVLYFYPKDDTPGCTMEGLEFTSLLKKFEKLNTVVLGASRDSVKSHQKFCEKHNLALTLISDEDQKLCDLFGVMKEKNMYGKKVWGVNRSTFLFDTAGKLVHEWRNVTAEGHAAIVLDKVKELCQ